MRAPTILLFGLIATCTAAPDADACFSPSGQRTIFFKEDPTSLPFPAVARITVIAVGEGNIGSPRTRYRIARVDQVIKGTIDRPVIWIPIVDSSCGPYVEVGSRGVVAGKLRQTAQGALELIPFLNSL